MITWTEAETEVIDAVDPATAVLPVVDDDRPRHAGDYRPGLLVAELRGHPDRLITIGAAAVLAFWLVFLFAASVPRSVHAPTRNPGPSMTAAPGPTTAPAVPAPVRRYTGEARRRRPVSHPAAARPSTARSQAPAAPSAPQPSAGPTVTQPAVTDPPPLPPPPAPTATG